MLAPLRMSTGEEELPGHGVLARVEDKVTRAYWTS